MACATLKRSLDWEPVIGARPAKRRRCIPFCASPSSYKEKAGPSCSTSPSSNTTPTMPVSAFPDVVTQKLTPEYMAASIKAELKRLQRCRQLQFSSTVENSDGNSSSNENLDGSSKDRALFTFKQVGMICERMIRERETEIREEYDNVLTAKLAEQYDAFVRFTYDQIQKNYQASPTYLS